MTNPSDSPSASPTSSDRPHGPRRANPVSVSLLATVAAFATYFCMYAFRKPFSAGTFENQFAWGTELKAVLVATQLAGYAFSKFIGIKIISEMRREYRALSIVGLIVTAELALLAFAVVPVGWKPVMLFLNGLPLGMVFGLVLAFLEGRKQTEALTAGLCASFVVASGVVKSVGRTLVLDYNVGEFWMPAVTGGIFLAPLLIAVWFLQRVPDPSLEDQQLRMKRTPMSRRDRLEFFSAYSPGLSLLLAIFVALTVMRSIRDDFGVEIWSSLGYSTEPSIFAKAETVVAIVVTVLNAIAIVIRNNRFAFQAVMGLTGIGFAFVGISIFLLNRGAIGGFPFMVLCGIGLYLPYVAFHTTVFERLIAASRRPGNIGFLMYLADTLGYFGYVGVILLRKRISDHPDFLSLFQSVSLTLTAACLVSLVLAVIYFQRAFPIEAHNK